MILRFLGTAAGGGVPQWDCACERCTAAREGRLARRTQSAAAVSADGKRWLLLNCSPDVAVQIEACAALQPRARRGTPIDGMLLTDANVDHLGGLAVLRQMGPHRFVVRSSAVVRALATAQVAFAAFDRAPHRWIAQDDGAWAAAADGDDLVGNALRVRAFGVPGTTPGYDGRRSVPGAVVAWWIEDPVTGGTLLFAPVFGAIDAPLERAIRAADVAVLDGSFFSDDEMLEQDLGTKRARALGHLPVGGPGGSLEALAAGARAKKRTLFTHLNNTNPMLDPSTPEHRSVAAAGAEIAFDGLELSV